MINVILSFDTEEFETPGSHEGAGLWLDLLEKHDLPGSFCVVSEKARLLVADGHRDIVERLACHEISSHTNWHCRPPVHAVYLDRMGWEAGVERVVREEAPGLSDLRAIFGRQPISWCKPGASWGPQSCVGFERLGVPVFSDAPFEAEPGCASRTPGLCSHPTSRGAASSAPPICRPGRPNPPLPSVWPRPHRTAPDGAERPGARDATKVCVTTTCAEEPVYAWYRQQCDRDHRAHTHRAPEPRGG